MHPVVVENLEEYVSGALAPFALREIEAHLNACSECREEVQQMREISGMFEALRPSDAPEPGPDFVVRVMRNAIRRPVVSVWSLLSPEGGFARRVVFASLLTLAVMGSYLVSRETNYSPGPPSAEAVMAADQSEPANPTSDREMMLVTLTSYEP